MKSKALLQVEDASGNLFASLKPELNDAVGDRASFTVKEEKGKVIISVEANDPVALRSSLNGIAKLLVIYDKLNGAQDARDVKGKPGKTAKDSGN